MTTSRVRPGKNPSRERDVSAGQRSPWNLLLFSAVILFWVGLWCTLVLALSWLHLRLYPTQHLLTSRGVGRMLAVVAAFAASLLPAMIAANGLIWLIPSARRVLEREAEPFPEGSFARAQRYLFHLARVLVPSALLLAAMGAMLSW